MELLNKDYSGCLKAAEDSRVVTATITTETLDRDGDVVKAAGIDLGPYRKNPIVLWQHDWRTPVGRAVELRGRNGGIEADVRFPSVGVSAKADEVYGLIQEGVINTTSIGFMPLDYDYDETTGGFIITSAELYEFSFVSVPSNRDAIISVRSAMASKLTPKTHGSTAQRNRHIEVLNLRGIR